MSLFYFSSAEHPPDPKTGKRVCHHELRRMVVDSQGRWRSSVCMACEDRLPAAEIGLLVVEGLEIMPTTVALPISSLNTSLGTPRNGP